MTFVINAIQQSSDQQRSVEFLVAVDSDSLARKFLEKSGLVLLSVKPLVGDDTHYRTSYLTVSYENGVVKCSSSKYLLLKPG